MKKWENVTYINTENGIEHTENDSKMPCLRYAMIIDREESVWVYIRVKHFST